MDLKERDALGSQADTHWYYVSKAWMISEHLPARCKTLLDVGAGIGWFSKWFINNGRVDRCICVDPGYDIQEPAADEMDGRIQFVQQVEETDADVVLMMDVLEHVDDDVALLREYIRKARPGSTFILTVPAFKLLWSSHDEFLQHRRRYTIGTLRETIRRAGAEPLSIHYFFAAILPVAALVRLLRPKKGKDHRSDLSPVPSGLNAFLTSVCRLEGKFSRLNRIGGLSVVAIFKT